MKTGLSKVSCHLLHLQYVQQKETHPCISLSQIFHIIPFHRRTYFARPHYNNVPDCVLELRAPISPHSLSSLSRPRKVIIAISHLEGNPAPSVAPPPLRRRHLLPPPPMYYRNAAGDAPLALGLSYPDPIAFSSLANTIKLLVAPF